MVKYTFHISYSFQWQRRFQESTELIAESQELCRKATQVLNNKYIDLDKPRSENFDFVVRSFVYVVLPCFEFEYSRGPQNSQNKSSKDLYRRKKHISANFYIPGLSNNPALCTTSLPVMSARSNEKNSNWPKVS